MKPGHAYWQVVSQVWDEISIYDGETIFLAQFSKANAKQQHLFAAHWCQSEIRNGGFHQFFWNSTGILAPEGINAFRAIGMPNTAAFIEKARMFFGAEYPRDRNKRIDILDDYARQNPGKEDPFEDMHDEFFELLEQESDGFERAADRYAALESSNSPQGK